MTQAVKRVGSISAALETVKKMVTTLLVNIGAQIYVAVETDVRVGQF